MRLKIAALALSMIMLHSSIAHASATPVSEKLATDFVEKLYSGAEGGEYETQSIGITCPIAGTGLNPFKGIVVISKPDWTFGQVVGSLVFKKPVENPVSPATVMYAETGDDFDGPVKGLSIHFDQPNGEMYLTVYKTGKATVEAHVNGGSTSKPVKCKVIRQEDL